MSFLKKRSSIEERNPLKLSLRKTKIMEVFVSMEQSNGTTKARKWKQLSEGERYQIERWLSEGRSVSEIATLLAKSIRTIQREIKRGKVLQRHSNKSYNKYAPEYIEMPEYKADYAQSDADEKASHKGRSLKIGRDQRLADFIEDLLKKKWSPDTIIGTIKAECLQFDAQICTKTVYNYIYSGLFRDYSEKDMIFGRESKRPKDNKRRTVALNNRDGQSIEKRPKAVNLREEMWHWEIDLVVGKAGTKKAILTLVERKTRKSLYELIPNKTQNAVLKALRKVQKRAKGDFSAVFASITADNGPEFLDGAGIKKASGCKEVFYAHPYCSWEKGSNENGNRMLRRFLPKGTDFSEITEKQLQRIENWVNNYPRRMFGYKSANQMMEEIQAA